VSAIRASTVKTAELINSLYELAELGCSVPSSHFLAGFNQTRWDSEYMMLEKFCAMKLSLQRAELCEWCLGCSALWYMRSFGPCGYDCDFVLDLGSQALTLAKTTGTS